MRILRFAYKINYRGGSMYQRYNYTSVNNKKSYSWPAIIVLLILFFPVGFYLLYKRFTVDKTAIQRNRRGLTVSGLIFIGIGLLYTLMLFSDEQASSDGTSSIGVIIALSLTFYIIGLVFLLKSLSMKALGVKYKKYINIIINQKQSSIQNIAAGVGVTYEAAVYDLRDMLGSGYFPGAFLNEQTREIILRQSAAPEAAYQTRAVTCKGCGASNVVAYGRKAECEYCGSSLEIR